MKVTALGIPDVLLLEPEIHVDESSSTWVVDRNQASQILTFGGNCPISVQFAN